MLKRREFITLLGGMVAAAGPAASRAQSAMPLVGYLGAESPTLFASRLRAFHAGLGRLGFSEGQNLTIEYRWAEGNNDRLPALAAELAQRQVAVHRNAGKPCGGTGGEAGHRNNSDRIRNRRRPDRGRPRRRLAAARRQHHRRHVVECGRRRQAARIVARTRAVSAHLCAAGQSVQSEECRGQHRGFADRRQNPAMRASHHPCQRGRRAGSGLREPRQAAAGGLVIANETFFANRSERLAALSRRYAVPAVHQSREFAGGGRPDELWRQR